MSTVQEALARPIRRVGDTPVVGPVVKGLLFGLGTYVVARALFGTPLSLMLYAGALGALYGLLGAGIIIIYRTNRIVNFAVGAMGAAPAVFALTLYTNKGWSYWAVLPLALVAGALLGALVHLVIIKRFSTAPRLILTVVTIGIAQLLAFIAFMTPTWLGVKGLPDSVRTPFSDWTVFRLGTDRITGDYFIAAVTVAVLAIGLGAFFKFTRMGIAIRASAENADRALTLGIPVERVSMVAWTIAGFFSAVTVFLRSPLVGLPLGGLASASILLFALTAAVIGRMESIPLALAGGIAIGVMDQSSVYASGRSDLAIALMLPVILIALFLQKTGLSRAHDTGVSSFRSVKENRPIPLELRRLPEVRVAKVAVGAFVVVAALTAPIYLGNELGKGSLVVISAIVAVSLVVLTGWAGQISLGQFAFTGIGASVAGGLAANQNMDFFATLIIGGLAGALVAVLIGLPALRVQGLFLAVTTLAFAAATDSYLLKPNQFFGKLLLPNEGESIFRPVLWDRVSLGDPLNETPYYYFCLVFLALAIVAAMSFRRHRSGRVLIALRDNSRAASSYAVNVARNRLAAFAISGFLAAIAGVLYVYQTLAIDAGSYGPSRSIFIFAAAVIGGISSIGGAVLGVVIVQGVTYFEDRIGIDFLGLLVTGPGLILVLYTLPGGFAEGLFRVRDSFLRWVANKHAIHVPSLVADRRIEEAEAKDDSLVHLAEERVEAVEEAAAAGLTVEVLGGIGTTILCPVCGVTLTLDQAAVHDHLQPVTTQGASS